MRHDPNGTRRPATPHETAVFSLRLNSRRFERKEIDADTWARNVRLIIDRAYPNG
jgi:hypothetical protein